LNTFERFILAFCREAFDQLLVFGFCGIWNGPKTGAWATGIKKCHRKAMVVRLKKPSGNFSVTKISFPFSSMIET
jgi:hypothetical protein